MRHALLAVAAVVATLLGAVTMSPKPTSKAADAPADELFDIRFSCRAGGVHVPCALVLRSSSSASMIVRLSISLRGRALCRCAPPRGRSCCHAMWAPSVAWSQSAAACNFCSLFTSVF